MTSKLLQWLLCAHDCTLDIADFRLSSTHCKCCIYPCIPDEQHAVFISPREQQVEQAQGTMPSSINVPVRACQQRFILLSHHLQCMKSLHALVACHGACMQSKPTGLHHASMSSKLGAGPPCMLPETAARCPRPCHWLHLLAAVASADAVCQKARPD